MYPAELLRRLRHFVQRDRVTRELEEEMRIHVEMRAESLRRLHPDTNGARHEGDDAPSKARDVKFATRRLMQQRAFSLSVIGVMAIGIGAVTAMFSAVDAALLRPLPFRAAEQLVVLPPLDVPFNPGFAQPDAPDRKLDITDARTMPRLFTDVAAFAAGGANMVDADQPLRLKVGVVTPNFFSTLGITPVRGRTFVDEEGVPNAPDVVMLSYGLWQREFGGRDVAGIHVTLGTRSFEVVGVMPHGFSFPSESDLWVPLSIPMTFATMEFSRGFLNTQTLARLASGVTTAVANTQLLARMDQWQNNVDERAKSMYAGWVANAHSSGAAQPLQQALVGDHRTALFVLLGATGLLLLIACVNVTNLLLSQASARRRELAVRQVLGATGGRIIRQLLTESVMLSLSGAMLGVLLAPSALRVLRTLLPTSLAGVAPAEVNVRVLIFAVATAVITGVGFGIWPAFRSARDNQSEVIKGGGGHGATSGSAGRVRRALVSAELALTVMLLVGAGLMLRSFTELMQRDSGLHSEHVGTLELSVASVAGDQNERVRKLDEILVRLSAMPGIQSAGAVNDLPLAGQGGISIQIDVVGAPPLENGERRGARNLISTGGYFPALGIKLLRGRLFSTTDNSPAQQTMVISKTMADAYWPDLDPLGRTVNIGRNVMTVIGVVADVREAKLEHEAGPQMYLNMLTSPPTRLALVARGTLGEQALLARMVEAVRSVDRSQAVYNVRMMEDVVSLSVAPRRANTVLIAAFAILALVLASVGVFAVVSYGVSHRSRELGIRSALGATGSGLVAMLASEMVLVTAAGIVMGLGGAWALSKSLESLVYGVHVHDPVTFIVVPLALVLPVVAATLIPARRALALNPADVMRAD